MITSPRQLMDRIKNLVGNDSTRTQTTMRLYAMERFLDRLARSPWRGHFIVKGGTLVTALVGVSMRTTMDIDATVRDIALQENEILRVVGEICALETGDGMVFHVKSADRIMDEHDYPGIRLSMEALLDRARIPMKLDFSTDDAITPGAVEIGYPRLLEDGEIPIMAYNLETLLAEKLETVISRGVTNTRMRDFYDIFALLEVKGESIETPILRAAIEATFGKRETDPSPENARLVLSEVKANERMREMWSRYQSKSDYARGIAWEDAVRAASRLIDALEDRQGDSTGV